MKKTLSFKGLPVTIEDKLNVGDVFPNFKATKSDLSDFNLEDYKGKAVVVTTFPSVDTGICALQAKRFNKEIDNFDNAVVVTVSKDLPFALNRFCAAEGVENAVTVSDYKIRDVENNLGLYMKEVGLLARTVYVLDNKGVIRYKEICEEVGSEPNFEKALEVLKEVVAG